MAAVLFKEPLNSKKTGDDLCRLILSGHKANPLLKNYLPDPRLLKKFTRGCADRALKTGVCDTLYVSEKLCAAILILEIELAPGLPFKWGFIETDRSARSAKWVLSRMQIHRKRLLGNTMFDLPFYLKSLIPEVYRIGYFIDTIRTVGGTRTAYRNWMKFLK